MFKKTFSLLLFCYFAAFPPILRAADTMENRFLFLVDTSSAMSNLSDEGCKAVQKLLASGIEGQLRKGDTVGAWTYNDILHDEFPMQVWSEADKQKISDRILGFLRSRKCEKKARLDRVLPSMYSAIQASRTLTVILVSNGAEEIKGTPFDKDINELHVEYGKNLRESNLPFVTILAARDGSVFDYTVNSAASNIRVPQTAEPVKAAALTPATNSPPPVPPIKTPVLAPKPEPKGIEIGSHPKPAPLVIAPAPAHAPEPEIKTQAVTSVAPIEFTPSNPPPTNPTVAPEKNETQKAASAPAAPVPAVEEKSAQVTTSAWPNVTSTPLAATQTVPQKDHSTRVLLVTACFLLAVFVMIIAFLVFRLRGTSQTSLISQSMAATRQKGPPEN